MSAAEKARRTVLGIEIKRDELALRIAKECLGSVPPPGVTAADALAQLETISPGITEGFRRAADAAVAYFHECINAARQPN